MKKGLLIASLLCFAGVMMAQPKPVENEEDEIKGAHPYLEYENEKGVVEEYSHWSITPHIGFNVYDGDFNSEKKHAFAVPNLGLSIEYGFTPNWAVGLDYMFDRYNVKGKQGEGRDNADTLLTGNMHKAGIYLSLDLINMFFPRAPHKVVSVFPLIGAGYTWYRNTKYFNDESRFHTGSYVWPDGTVGPKSMDAYAGEFYLQGGLNLDINCNRTIAVGLRATYNYFVNDFMDGRGYRGETSIASKNNDGIFDVTLNLRFKILAVSKTHVRNISGFETWEKNEPIIVHDTIVYVRDTTVLREKVVHKENKSDHVFYIYFDNNSAELTDEGMTTIQQIADRMYDDPSLYAVVTGYCDNTGSNNYNYELGDRRANNVIDELEGEYLIDTTRTYSLGIGKLIGHRYQAGFAPNRRVMVRLVDKSTFKRLRSELQETKGLRSADGYVAQPEGVNRVAVLNEGAEGSKAADGSNAAEQTDANAAGSQAGENADSKAGAQAGQDKAESRVGNRFSIDTDYASRPGADIEIEPNATLAKLARKHYNNNTFCWVFIYLANKAQISHPNALNKGQKLHIPQLTDEEKTITKDECLELYHAANPQ